MENIDLLGLYNKGNLTQFALERELSQFLGDRSEVVIVSSSSATSNSFGVFPVADLRSNGFYLICYIDKPLLTKCSSEELINVLSEISKNKQILFKKFNEFLKSGIHSKNEVLACYLNLYNLMLNIMVFSENVVLPSVDELNNAIIKLEDGVANAEDLEHLLVSGIIFTEIVELAGKMATKTQNEYDDITTPIKDEVPSFGLGRQEIRKYANPTLGDVSHNEIKYDYIPSTN